MAVRLINGGSAIFRCCAVSPPITTLRRCLHHHKHAQLHSSTCLSVYRRLRCRRSISFGYERVAIRRCSSQSAVDMLVEELESLGKRCAARASNKLEMESSEELFQNKPGKKVLQKGLLLEFKKDSERVLLAVVQKPDGKRNWMVSDQNGVMTSIKPQQVNFIVPGIKNFDQAEISNFIEKAQDNLDPALLEFAWIELAEKNKPITVEELAEMMFGSAEPLESYSAYLLLSKDDIYFSTLETKGSYSVYGPRPAVQVKELMRKKHAKEAAERELEEFVNILRSARDMPLHEKPPKSMWISEEKNQKQIECLQGYAIDDCRNEDDKKTAGMILKAMGLARTASAAMNLLIDIGYFPVHVNLDLLKFNIRTDYAEEILTVAESLLFESPDPDEVDRKDLTHLKVYAIDVDEADELDDALSATRLQDGRIKIWIHVADPTRLVRPGSIIDNEARKRSTSIFLPSATYSMFPEKLAMEGMSLKQGEHCKAVTVSVVLHGDGG